MCAGKAWDDDRPVAAALTVRRCAACEGALSRGEAPGDGCTCGAGKAAALVASAVASPARPLDPAARAFFEPRYRADLGGVRVHTGGTADASARAVGALAYTVGRDVVFREGAYAPATPAGQRVLAHELAHVAQQGAAPAPRLAALAPLDLGRADDPAERQADAAASAALAGTPVPALTPDPDAPVRPLSLGFLEDAWDATSGAVGDAAGWVADTAVEGAEWVGEKAEEVWEWTKEQIAELVEELAPGLLDFLRGDVLGLIRDKIAGAFEWLFGDLAGRIAREGLVGALSSLLAEAAGGIATAAEGLGAGACDLVLTIAGAIGDFVTSFTGPLFEGIGAAASAVAGFLSGLWEKLGKPAWEAIKAVAGTAWEWIESTAAWLWDLTAPVRDAVAAAWSWLMEQFGLAWDTAGGILDWIREKAAAAWATILEWIEPVLGPLKVIGGILLMLSPLGPVVAIAAGGVALWKGLKWLWENWEDLSIVVTAREFLSGTLLPAVLSGIEWLKGALAGAVAWLSEMLGSAVEALGSLMEALGVNALLAGLSWLVEQLRGFFADALGWVAETLAPVVETVGAVLSALWDFLRPILAVTLKLVFIATNPWTWPMVIAGWAWRILPDCLKGPIIDWVLGVMIWAVEALPDFASLGEAWAQARAKVLESLAAARALPMEEKIAVSDRVARIMRLEDLTWLWNMINAARKAPGEFEGQVQEELIGMDLTQPLPFERAKEPSPAQLAGAAGAAGGMGLLTAGDASVLSRPLTEADVAVDAVAALALDPALVSALALADGQETGFGENPDPAATLDAIRAELAAPGAAAGPAAAAPRASGAAAEGEAAGPAAPSHEEETERRLQEMIDQPGPEACKEEAKEGAAAKGPEIPEPMKIGPLTRAQRGRYLLSQMWKGIKHWFGCNAHWLVPTLIVAAIALIAAEIFTGGAITAALPAILGGLGTLFVGVAVVRGTFYLGEYVAKAVSGDVDGGARSLARAVAIAVVELVFLLLFEVAALLKAIRAAVVAAARGAGRAAKTAASAATKTAGRVLKSTRLGRGLAEGASALGGGVRRTAGAALRNGKLVMRGVGDAVAEGARTLDDLARRLWKRVRFRRFKIRRSGHWFQLWGEVNPWVLLATGTVEWVDEAADVGAAAKVGRKKGFVVEPDAAPTEALKGLNDLPASVRKQYWRRLNEAADETARKAVAQEIRKAGEGIRRMTADLGPAEVRALSRSHGAESVAWAAADLAPAEARALLKALPSKVAAALRDVPSTEAKRLLEVFGDDLLGAAAVPAGGGRRLSTLTEMLGDHSAMKLATQQRVKGELPRLKEFADNLDAARKAELLSPTPVGADTLILDSNTYIALEKLMRGEPWHGVPVNGKTVGLNLRDQEAINMLRDRANLPRLTGDPPARDMASLVGTPDIRVPNMVIAESTPLPGLKRSGLSLRTQRTGAEYKKVLEELEKLPQIGKKKGAADRSVVADALFAAEPGKVPVFMTADSDMFARLAKRFGVTDGAHPVRIPTGQEIAAATKASKAAGGNPINEAAVLGALNRGGFDVEILGHRMLVIPVSEWRP